jgi:amidophosphoribosyltransferase
MVTKDESCVFDFIYYFDGATRANKELIGATRFMAGCELAKIFKLKADIVAAVPNTAFEVARGYAYESKIEFSEIILVKKDYGRYFTQETAEQRELVVGDKFIFMPEQIKGKRIILIDDSLVRGATMKRVVSKLRELGAKAIHVLLASPAVIKPCEKLKVSDEKELAAFEMSTQQICQYIQADTLHFLPFDRVSYIYGNNKEFCSRCLSDNPHKNEK